MLKHYFGIFWERIKQIIHTHRNLQILLSKIIQNDKLSKWIIYIVYHDLIINSGDVCREVSWSCLWHVRTLVIWKRLILSTQKRNKILNWPKNIVFPIDIWADFGTRENLRFGNKKLRPRETTRPVLLWKFVFLILGPLEISPWMIHFEGAWLAWRDGFGGPRFG